MMTKLENIKISYLYKSYGWSDYSTDIEEGDFVRDSVQWNPVSVLFPHFC